MASAEVADALQASQEVGHVRVMQRHVDTKARGTLTLLLHIPRCGHIGMILYNTPFLQSNQ